MAVKHPTYTYTGVSEERIDSRYWYIYMKTGGTLKFTKANPKVDICLVGGGGGGTAGTGGGGGGGYVNNLMGIRLTKGVPYNVTIGEGGAVGTWSSRSGKRGGTTSLGDYKAAGGYGGSSGEDGGTTKGGDGGSGGAGMTPGGVSYESYAGGSNGYDGEAVEWQRQSRGLGQRTTPGPNGETGSTYAFGDSSLTLYAGGGGGGGYTSGPGGAGGGGAGRGILPAAEPGTYDGLPNTGGGGGAGLRWYYSDDNQPGWQGGNGGSGIAIVRGERGDSIPVTFDGTELEAIIFNGTEVESLIVDGVTLY